MSAETGELLRWCTKCGRPINDQKRIRRKSPYCSDDCRREGRREMRALLAQGRCRLCGRTQRRPSQAAVESACVAPGAHGTLLFDSNQPHNQKG
jgi:hypothetical protein